MASQAAAAAAPGKREQQGWRTQVPPACHDGDMRPAADLVEAVHADVLAGRFPAVMVDADVLFGAR